MRPSLYEGPAIFINTEHARLISAAEPHDLSLTPDSESPSPRERPAMKQFIFLKGRRSVGCYRHPQIEA